METQDEKQIHIHFHTQPERESLLDAILGVFFKGCIWIVNIFIIIVVVSVILVLCTPSRSSSTKENATTQLNDTTNMGQENEEMSIQTREDSDEYYATGYEDDDTPLTWDKLLGIPSTDNYVSSSEKNKNIQEEDKTSTNKDSDEDEDEEHNHSKKTKSWYRKIGIPID